MEDKLELTRDDRQDLTLYFFIAKRPNEERVVAILAFQLEDAFQGAKQEAMGFILVFTGQKVPMKELLFRLQIDRTISPPISPEKVKAEQPLSAEKINFESFKNGLLLVVDDYVEFKDKEVLKGILGRLQYPK